MCHPNHFFAYPHPLHAYESDEHLQKQAEVCYNKAREKMVKKDRRGAALELKKKKTIEKRIEVIMNTMMTMEEQKMALETAVTQQVAVEAIREAKNAIAASTLDVDEVNELMDENQELIQEQQEVSDALASSATVDNIMNDDELMKELDDIEQDQLAESMGHIPDVPALPDLSIPALPSMPQVPTTTPAAASATANELDADAAALADLEGLMDMGGAVAM